jgi:hypothetical protein
MNIQRLWGEFVTALAFFAVGAVLALRQDAFPWAGLVGVAVYFGVLFAVHRRRARSAATPQEEVPFTPPTTGLPSRRERDGG